MALRHKQLDVQYRPILLTDKESIAFSGGTTVPVIRDGDTVMRDSWSIAEYLEATYPDRPSLFGGDTGQALARLANNWVDRTVLAAAFPLLSIDALAVQHQADRPYFTGLIERLCGAGTAELREQQPGNAKRLAKAVDPARATLKRQAYLSGDSAGLCRLRSLLDLPVGADRLAARPAGRRSGAARLVRQAARPERRLRPLDDHLPLTG